eukprot:1007858_1
MHRRHTRAYDAMNVMPQNAVNAKKLKRKSNETFVCHQILLLTSTEPPSSIALQKLIESVQCYGQFITPKTRYYMGIHTQFVLKRFSTRFNAPLSTTPSLQKAVAL